MLLLNVKRKLAFLMAICTLLLLIFSEVYLVNNINHKNHCREKECPICMGIQVAEAVIHQIGTALQAVCILFAIAIMTARSISITNQVNLFHTPVKMKVRMNN